MAKYVPDIKTQRWVIIAGARTKRPDSAEASSGKPDDDKGALRAEALAKACPFCPGNEQATPPEVYRIGLGGKDEPGWQVRVVPNKYTITDTHEVFIHSTSHTDDVRVLPLDQVARIVTCYRDRYRAHEADGQVIIFCNQGKEAGASLAHSHSQLVVVPKQINLDSLSREPCNNIVDESDGFIVYCPDFSQWPYETWIAPKEEGDKFGDIKETALKPLAHTLQKTLQRLSAVYEKSSFKRDSQAFVYNYYISHSNNWFIRIIPRFIHRAGFELGTGLNVNIIDPSQAASDLQKSNTL